MPFTLRNLKQDMADLGSRFDGAPDLEFRSATDALQLEESGLISATLRAKTSMANATGGLRLS